MKKIFTLFAALVCVLSMSAVTYNVTVPAGTKACYIAGDMNSWSFTEMTKVDDTHYTLDLPSATKAMKYKYCSGPGWAYVEKDASGNEIGDRAYSAEDVVAKWASVYDPGNVPTPGEAKDITIKAKVPATWTNTITAWVWPTGGAGKEVTPAKEGEWYVYTEKCSELNIIFKNGTGWNGDINQTVDITISESTCVEITAGTGKATYTIVDCEDNPGEEPGDDPIVDPETGVTYNVTVPAGTKACYIAGEMNEWKHQEMTKVDETHYTITIAAATATMKYKYCSGPDWAYVEMQADGTTDVQDRTYAANDVVEAWKAVYDPAGENPGEEPGDDPVVDPETGVTYNVTVPVGTKACYIAGEMNEWKHQEMTKVDETHYTITIATATATMKYKYCSGPDWAYVEMQADGTTDVQDRTYAANDVVEAWKAVYDPAGENPGEEPGDDPVVDPEIGVTYNVTVPAGTKACYIAGEMNSWSFTEMTKIDDTHYTVTLAEATEAMGYKYCSGPGWAYVELTEEDGEVANRTYAANDVVVKWASVYDPANAPTPGEAKDITIKAKVPATWTETITAWVWPTGEPGKAVTPTKEGEWYVYTEHCSELNIIFRNGEDWSINPNQTVDITVSESTCIEIIAGTDKATYTIVDCEDNPGEEPGDDPVVTPDPETGVTYTVTVPAGTKACYIAGEMNGWSHEEMTKVDETHYTITIATATTAMKYKYCSGPSWDYVEMLVDGITDVQDRTYSANDVVEAWKAVYEPAGEDPTPGEPKDITVKAKVPAAWTEQITAWVWATGGEGQEVVPTQEGEWYVYTQNCAELNIIFKNGAGWNGDANQTVDITVTESTCIEITADGATKATYTVVDCEGGEVIEPAQITYVLMGVQGDWTTGIELTKNETAEWEEYMLLGQTISQGDSVKVVRLEAGVAKHWCGNVKEGVTVTITYDDNGNIILAPGTYDFYYDVAADAIWIAEAAQTAVDNVILENKATKIIRNGQMYIIREGVMYNALGQVAE